MPAKTYQGRRVEIKGGYHQLKEFEYGRDPRNNDWYACAPGEHMGSLAAHVVTEHEDGTITVRPSILITAGKNLPLWHGHLERGIWREC